MLKPVLWPTKRWLTGKDPDDEKDWGQKEKRASVDEMAVWHQWYSGHELGQTSGDGEEQRGLACCSPLGLQRVRHDWATEQQQIHLVVYTVLGFCACAFNLSSWQPHNSHSLTTLKSLGHITVKRLNCSWSHKGCLLWPVSSLGKTWLAFALLHSVLQGQICHLLQVFDFLLLHSSPL